MNNQPTTIHDHLLHPRFIATDDLLDELQAQEAGLSEPDGDWMEDCRYVTIHQFKRAFVPLSTKHLNPTSIIINSPVYL